MRFSRLAFVPFLLFTVLGGLVSAPAGEATAGTPLARPITMSTLDRADDGQQVRLTRIGKPTWKPVDFHRFSAPIGTADTGYAEFCETALALLPEPNHEPNPDLGCVGPGEPHQPPYNKEVGDGVAALGFHEGGPFKVKEFSSGNAVWLAWMNVPSTGGMQGSSPDFDSGPIIPNELFPIQVSASTTHRGELFSDPAAFGVPALDSIGFDVDGHSHFPIFFAENTDFDIRPLDHPVGPYTFHIEMRDRDGKGDGWQIEAGFVVRR